MGMQNIAQAQGPAVGAGSFQTRQRPQLLFHPHTKQPEFLFNGAHTITPPHDPKRLPEQIKA